MVKLIKTKKTKKIFTKKHYNYKNNCKSGGAKGKLTDVYKTVSNSGKIIEEGKTKYNQCFWISIMDYLNMFRGLNVTVGQIKRLVDLPASTDTQQMDYWETAMYRTAVDILAELFDIRIEFYYIQRGKSVLYQDGLPIPQTIINDSSRNIVPIAFTGGHFELITSGPNLDPLIYIGPNPIMQDLNQTNQRNQRRNQTNQRNQRHQNKLQTPKTPPPPVPPRRTATAKKLSPPSNLTLKSTKPPPPIPPRRTATAKKLSPPPIQSKSYEIKTYASKVFNPQTNEYVQLDEIQDKDLKIKLQSEQTINENKESIKIYKSEIDLHQKIIDDINQNMASLHNLGLSSNEIKSIRTSQQKQVGDHTKQLAEYKAKIAYLSDEIEGLEQLIKHIPK